MTQRSVEYRSIIECASSQQLPEMLHELESLAVPGFIVRAPHWSSRCTPEDVHVEIAERVSAAYAQIMSADKPCLPRRTRSPSGEPFSGFGQAEIGQLHFDRNKRTLASKPFVNTTLDGGGPVIIAAMGPDITAASELRDPSEDADHPHNLLLQDLVEDRLMSPRVYYGDVAAGDSIVLREEGDHPTWHRFDTNSALGMRAVAVTTFVTK